MTGCGENLEEEGVEGNSQIFSLDTWLDSQEASHRFLGEDDFFSH